MKINMNLLILTHAIILIELVKAFGINKPTLEQFGYTIDSVKIDLSNKGIQTIDPTTFTNFSKLEILYLHENIIEKIELGTFNQLINLRELWLETNRIVSIPKSVVTGLSNLRLFCIYNNPLSIYNPSQVSSLCSSNKNCDLEMNESCKKKTTTTKITTTKGLLFLNK